MALTVSKIDVIHTTHEFECNYSISKNISSSVNGDYKLLVKLRLLYCFGLHGLTDRRNLAFNVSFNVFLDWCILCKPTCNNIYE